MENIVLVMDVVRVIKSQLSADQLLARATDKYDHMSSVKTHNIFTTINSILLFRLSLLPRLCLLKYGEYFKCDYFFHTFIFLIGEVCHIHLIIAQLVSHRY